MTDKKETKKDIDNDKKQEVEVKVEKKQTIKQHKKIKPCKLPQEVEIVISQLEKLYGKGSVMQMGGSSFAEVRNLYPTPCLALDIAIGLIRKVKDGNFAHGVPSGKIVEILGPEASGKTTLCNHIMASVQNAGGLVAMIDMENTWDPVYARKLGVKVEDVVISQPDYGEQALNTAEQLVSTGKFSVVVVDSIASLIPKAELEKSIGERTIGAQASLMSQACRKLSPLVNNTNTLLIFTNQLRFKIGVLFGNPETSSGGEAMKYFASLRLDIRKVGHLKDGNGNICGHRGRITTIKNKLAPPYRKVEFDMLHGKGIDFMGSLIDTAIEYGIIRKSGSWYSYGDEKIGQGKNNVVDYFKDNDILVETIRNEILNNVYEELYL